MNWFQGLRARILIIALLPFAGFLIMMGIFGHVESRLSSSMDILIGWRIPITKNIGEARTQLNTATRRMWRMVAAAEPQEMAELEHDIFSSFEQFEKNLNNLKNLNLVAKNKEHLDTILSSWPTLKLRMQDLISQSKNIQQRSANILELKKLGGEANQLLAIFADIDQLAQELNKKTGEDAKTLVYESRILSLSVFAILILIFLSSGLWMSNKLFNQLSNVSKEIADSSHQVSLASSELSNASQSISMASSDAAASLEETVASLEEISSQVQKNAESATQAKQIAEMGQFHANDGESKMTSMLSAIQKINEESQKAQDIINIIDEIAFQTNLLALNAAVEAARAGDHGKGFNVVAEAVRALAQRSSVAAKDIKGLIEASAERTLEGAKLARETSETLIEIVRSTSKVTTLIQEIAVASEQQSVGINQITSAVNQLDNSTQQNAANSEEAAATSEELNAQSLTMSQIVNTLQNLIHGHDLKQLSMEINTAQHRSHQGTGVILPHQKRAA